MSIFLIIVIILVQIFSYLLSRALTNLCHARTPRVQRILTIGCLILPNLLIFSFLFLEWKTGFRWFAFYLLVLLFAFFTFLLTQIAWKVLQRKKIQVSRPTQTIITITLFFSWFAIAFYNAYTPTVHYAHIQINKPLSQPLRIGMAADLHLGKLVGTRQLKKLNHIMQTEKVDLIVLPGDIMDDDTLAYEAENMHEQLKQLTAPLGVYATLGNHDLFGQKIPIVQALNRAGITVLHDHLLRLDNGLWIVGRPDQLDTQRLPTAQLLQNIPEQEAVLLLDHRPNDVLAHSKMNVDIQVSGHVHNGQVFPANLLVRFLNGLHYGYRQIGNGHFFVTSGFGFWGIPFRLGSQAEVWIIDVTGKNNQKPIHESSN